MPVIAQSTFVPPRLLRNGHVQTIFGSRARFIKAPPYLRERIFTSDEDFLDLDWLRQKSKRLVILTHGLEGNSSEPYILGMARAFYRRGFDILAWNHRGCSGEINRHLYSYHIGSSQDLREVVQHVVAKNDYETITLIGFSLGGNITLKYLGEEGEKVHEMIENAVTFSVPCDVESCVNVVNGSSNRIYFHTFMRSIVDKMKRKSIAHNHPFPFDEIKKARSFRDLDHLVTVPHFGFKDVDEFWKMASSARYLDDIHVPTLLVNALDDPLLAPPCFPFEQAQRSIYLWLETPPHGGHCAFVQFNQRGEYWSEQRALEFVIGQLD